MWQKLNLKQRNWIAIAVIIVLLYLAYVFSFRPSLAAIALNHQLEQERNDEQVMDGSFAQLDRKHMFYLEALKAFQVKKQDREIRLWQSLSATAMANNVSIGYNPSLAFMTDTLMKKGIVTQQFSFKGNYFDMVRLLDTLSKSKGIGQISSLTLSLEKDLPEKEVKEKLDLQLRLMGVER